MYFRKLKFLLKMQSRDSIFALHQYQLILFSMPMTAALFETEQRRFDTASIS